MALAQFQGPGGLWVAECSENSHGGSTWAGWCQWFAAASSWIWWWECLPWAGRCWTGDQSHSASLPIGFVSAKAKNVGSRPGLHFLYHLIFQIIPNTSKSHPHPDLTLAYNFFEVLIFTVSLKFKYIYDISLNCALLLQFNSDDNF